MRVSFIAWISFAVLNTGCTWVFFWEIEHDAGSEEVDLSEAPAPHETLDTAQSAAIAAATPQEGEPATVAVPVARPAHRPEVNTQLACQDDVLEAIESHATMWLRRALPSPLNDFEGLPELFGDLVQIPGFFPNGAEFRRYRIQLEGGFGHTGYQHSIMRVTADNTVNYYYFLQIAPNHTMQVRKVLVGRDRIQNASLACVFNY